MLRTFYKKVSTVSKVLVRSIKAKKRLWCCSRHFSCSRRATKIMSVVPHPRRKPDCDSGITMSTTCVSVNTTHRPCRPRGGVLTLTDQRCGQFFENCLTGAPSAGRHAGPTGLYPHTTTSIISRINQTRHRLRKN